MPPRKLSKNCPDCGVALIRQSNGFFRKRCTKCQTIFENSQKTIYEETRKPKRRVPARQAICDICNAEFVVHGQGLKRKFCDDCRSDKQDVNGKRISALPVRLRSRKYFLLKNYKLTLENRNDILITQNNSCAICGLVETTDSFLHVDHDHACCSSIPTCGKCIRGLLCARCNRALGFIQDNYHIAEALSVYLTDHIREAGGSDE